MNCHAPLVGLPGPRTSWSSGPSTPGRLLSVPVRQFSSSCSAASSVRSFGRIRSRRCLCSRAFLRQSRSSHQPNRLIAASVTLDSASSEEQQDGTLFLHVLDEHLARGQQPKMAPGSGSQMQVSIEKEVPDQSTSSYRNSDDLEFERGGHVTRSEGGDNEASKVVMTNSALIAVNERLVDLNKVNLDLEFGSGTSYTGGRARPVDRFEKEEDDVRKGSVRGGDFKEKDDFPRTIIGENLQTKEDCFGETQLSCSESRGSKQKQHFHPTSSREVLGKMTECTTDLIERKGLESSGSREGDSAGLTVESNNSLNARERLKIGRQVFLSGEHDYTRWMPISEEPAVEATVPASVQPRPNSMGQSVAGNGESMRRDALMLQPQEVEGIRRPVESADVPRTGTGTGEDLFIEFLKRRRKQWGDNAHTGMRGGKGGDVDRESPPGIAPDLTENSIDSNCKGADGLYPNSTESLSESEKEQTVKAATESLLETLSSGVTDESFRTEAVAQGVLSIARVLPLNASLETYMTPFSGKISTGEGNLALKVLGEASLPWPMLSFFQWMRIHKPSLLDSRSFCTLFSNLGSVGMGDQAFLQYQNMPDDPMFHCVQVYNSLIGALAKSGRHGKIPSVLKQMEERHVERDHFTYCILLAATKGGDGRIDEVWGIFDEMLKTGLKPSIPVYGALVKAFCDEGHLKQALLVSLSMEKSGLSPNVIIYNMLIDAHGKALQLEEAEGLLLELKQRGLSPTGSTYNALINAYGKAGQLDVAEELVVEMQSQGVKPDVVTYTALIGAYGKHKMSEKAANAFLKMRKSGVVPTTHSYTALINAYAEAGWHDKAQKAFDDMKVVGLKPTVETYTALIDAYRRAGNLDMVRYLWNAIKEDGCELTRITYRTIVDAFGKYGFYVEARDVVDEFRKYGIKPDTMIFNILLNAYARGGLQTKLPKIYREMQDAGCDPDSYTYCTLIYAYIRLRNYTQAFEYESEMVEKGLVPPPKVYRKMKFILDGKYALKLENDRKANAGQEPKDGSQNQAKNAQQSKHRKYKKFLVRGPLRGSERMKALWKSNEKGGSR